jgi:hypothetical protein
VTGKERRKFMAVNPTLRQVRTESANLFPTWYEICVKSCLPVMYPRAEDTGS